MQRLKEGKSGLHYYIAHPAMIRPERKKTKLRVVFDVSCKSSNGKSLNDVLLKGDIVQPDLFDILLRFREYVVAFSRDIKKMPKYFTYRDVALHNKKDDLWVILFKKVLDITPLCQEIESEGVFPLLAFGGKDIGHFFDDQGEVKFHLNPETNKIDTFAPFRAFIDIPSQERIEETCLKRRFQDENMADKLVERFSKQRFNKIDINSNILKLPVKNMKPEDADIPWWQDEKYVIGLLTDKSRSCNNGSALQERSFSSQLLLSLSVFLHRRSERLIDVLYSLGFAASYGKTVQYEISTAYHPQPRILSSESGALVRYVEDNADINVHTLDGNNTLHVMGMIKIVTPKDIY
ncbi:cytochrome b5 domain-containing protein 1 [Trichonephila inaurata madagascariensis]|uniref:Cytochrome b5 domain-containing protein 1 n=1 Tax=Trichonephila inaurata madagascariensis TaxID=2747483 RepID=A0A8X6IDD2_9ARAC|nr:cytochrome b5 domain-containing protein 1 [Trichonephila inaurata madagascariensis]